MQVKDLTQAEQKFLATYQGSKLHCFRDILTYARILRKLTKE
ncbi:hypothetical protein ACFSN5_09995 [Streptococcus tangpeifui]|nr:MULTISPECIES: hypothetical protein [unclassified Streptococcus]